MSKADTKRVIEQTFKEIKKSEIDKLMVKCVVKDVVPKQERAQSKSKQEKETNYRLSIDPERLITTFGDLNKQEDENIEQLTGFKTR
jgi:hypothetical protein